MRWIKGTIELRKTGAIGSFTVHPCRTQADSIERAKEYLIEDAHMYGFEPRAITHLEPITKAEYDLVSSPWQDMEEP